MTPKAKLRAAIAAKCKDCIYDPLSGLGSWRNQAYLCTVKTCPLYPYRPVPRSVSGTGFADGAKPAV